MTRARAHLILFVALVLVSTSGPFLHEAKMDAFAVVFFRMAGSALLFLAWAAKLGRVRVTSAQLRVLALAGGLLAAHWGLWIKAFDLTDYASNLLLLVVQPVTAVGVNLVRGQDRPTRNTWLSVALATVGLLLVAGGDLALGPRALLGDALCVLGALSITLFYVVAQEERSALPLPTFMFWSMGLGALWILPVVALSGARLVGYPAESWAWAGALVVLTTVGGHGLFNLAARHLSLFTVNVVIVLEPAIAIAMGAVLFGAQLQPSQLWGGLVLSLAVVFGLRP